MKFQALRFVITSFHYMVDEVGTELLLAALFCFGFTLFRVSAIRRLFNPRWSEKMSSLKLSEGSSEGPSKCERPAADVGTRFNVGNIQFVLSAWPWVKDYTICSVSRVMKTALDLAPNMSMKLQRLLTVASQKSSLRCQAPTSASKPRPRTTTSSGAALAFVQRIRTAVQDHDAKAAAWSLKAMIAAGHMPTPGCVVAVLRVQREDSDRSSPIEVVQWMPPAALSPPVVAAICDYAGRCNDIELLQDIEKRAAELELTLSASSCESLLRSFAAKGHCDAVAMFDKLVVQGGVQLSENSLSIVVAACTESRHIRMVDFCMEYAHRTCGKCTLPFYATAIKVYGHMRQFSKICEIYETMKKNGVELDTVAYGCVIRAAVESGRLELARKLFKESGNPDLMNCMSLIRAAGREQDVPKALELLRHLEATCPTVDVAAYNCALDACAACRDLPAAENLLRHMEDIKVVDVVSYNTYVKLLVGQDICDHSSKVFDRMQAHGVVANAVTYNSLIKGAASRQDLPLAWRLLDDMQQHGVSPDSYTCSILMKGMKHAAICGADVDRVLDLVRDAQIVPDEVLVSCLIDTCVKLRDATRLSKVLDEFRCDPAALTPHAAAMLIKALGICSRSNQAWALWRDLAKNNLSEELFASMVEACLDCSDFSGVVAVWRQAKSYLENFPRASALFATTAKKAVANKRLKLVMDLYGELKQHFPCTKVTFNTLIDAHVRQDDMTSALNLFREMALHGVVPDLITYSTLIRGHCSRGDLELGLQLLGQMQRRGIVPDAVLFNSLLDGCAHKQMRTLTEQVLLDMQKAGVAPSNITMSILVKLYGRCGDIPAAFQVIETYPLRFGFKLNTQVYTCLMSACLANGEQGRAVAVYDTLVKAGLQPDAKTYHTLLNGCMRYADLETAERVIDDALALFSTSNSAGFLVDKEALDGVLLMAVRLGKVAQVGQPMLEKVLHAGISVSGRVRAAVLRERGGAL